MDQVIYTEQPDKYLSNVKINYETWLLDELEHEELFEKLSTGINEFKEIKHLPDVSARIYLIYKHIKETYFEEDKLLMLWVSLLQDLGKPFCISEETTDYANFKGHENVSSQLSAVYLDLMGYSDEFIKKAVALIQFHMMPIKRETKKKHVKELIGDKLFTNLMILRDSELALQK